MTDIPAQEPLGSGFGPATTTDEVIKGIDLAGRIAIVTGGYSGLGRETVRTFLSAGAEVVVPARDVDRARVALEATPDAQVRPMDLMDPESIDAFAAAFLDEHDRLDLLVNSAGIMANPFTRDARGFESQFSTNHLGHFQLTARLWPALHTAGADGGARVVAVSSMGHRYSDVHLDDPHFEHRPYVPHEGYGQSKTANVLFALELDRRARDEGVRAFSLHPGGIPGTGLEKYIPRESLIAAKIIDEEGNPIIDPARQLKTVEQGAATQVWAATSPMLAGLGGLYCENCDVAPMMEPLTEGTSMDQAHRLRGVLAHAVDPDTARKLWTLSEELLDLRFL
ncbi:SDR family NAD(P)-dependent oxidoreductase [Pseudonocardia sp. CA-107938]|uniref:SDR family NAD(P)-dependent oxidoreductase n=1 Tax=Pseudonocardia sp. CA-107938 TaxID=3240021 RepID=UPI003D8F653F